MFCGEFLLLRGLWSHYLTIRLLSLTFEKKSQISCVGWLFSSSGASNTIICSWATWLIVSEFYNKKTPKIDDIGCFGWFHVLSWNHLFIRKCTCNGCFVLNALATMRRICHAISEHYTVVHFVLCTGLQNLFFRFELFVPEALTFCTIKACTQKSLPEWQHRPCVKIAGV